MASPRHKELQRRILEIGRFEEFLSFKEKKETKVGRFQVDAVWKKTKQSYPAFAFEVELSRQIAKSITSLRSAHNRWNCKGVLVTDGSDFIKARAILEEDNPDLVEHVTVIES